MEHLTKQQLILLALLLSFVTSIATGIITVSLMDQAPPAITQTINRVVERTVEKVVPSANTASVVAKETIVVKADDMVVKAIEDNKKSLVKIKEVYVLNGERKENISALGLVLSKDGLIATDAGILAKESDEITGETYFAVFPGDKVLPIVLLEKNVSTGVAYFRADEKDRIAAGVVYYPANLEIPLNLKLGQTIIAVSGALVDTVSTGIISALPEKSVIPQENDLAVKANVPVEKAISMIRTDIFMADIIPGSILLNLSGKVIGFKAGSAVYAKNDFLPISVLSTQIDRKSE
jgi:S1-C subfamily serine protease